MFLIGLIRLNSYLDRYASKYTKFQPKWPILDPNRCSLVNWPPWDSLQDYFQFTILLGAMDPLSHNHSKFTPHSRVFGGSQIKKSSGPNREDRSGHHHDLYKASLGFYGYVVNIYWGHTQETIGNSSRPSQQLVRNWTKHFQETIGTY